MSGDCRERQVLILPTNMGHTARTSEGFFGESQPDIKEALYRYQRIETAWAELDIANGKLLHSLHRESKRMRAGSQTFLMTDFYPSYGHVCSAHLLCVRVEVQ